MICSFLFIILYISSKVLRQIFCDLNLMSPFLTPRNFAPFYHQLVKFVEENLGGLKKVQLLGTYLSSVAYG